MATIAHLNVPAAATGEPVDQREPTMDDNVIAVTHHDVIDDSIRPDTTQVDETDNSSRGFVGLPRLSIADSIGSFHSHDFDDEQQARSTSALSQNVVDRMRDLIQRFAHRTATFKEQAVQPPTPSMSSIDGVSATSEVDEKAVGRQRRLDSFVSPALGGATDDSSGVFEVGRWKFKLPKFISRLRPPRSIDPNGNFFLCWLFIVTVAFLYNTIAAPLRTAFHRAPIYNNSGHYPSNGVTSDNVTSCIIKGNNTDGLNVTSDEPHCSGVSSSDVTSQYPDGIVGYFPGYQTPENIVYWWIIDYTCDVIYLVDIILVRRKVQFINNGLLETDPKEIFKNYRQQINFKLDVLSLTPLDIFYLVPSVYYCSLLRLPRVLKIHTFWEFYDRLDQRVSSAHIVRIVRTVTYMLFLIHVETCGFFAFSAFIGLGTDGDGWAYDGTGIAYIRCMYLSSKTAMSIGNNAIPNNQLEYMFVTFYWLTGIFVFAMLIGQIRDIFQAADANRDRYRKTVDQTIYYMKSLNVPKELQDRVRMWFNYNWEHTKTLDENSLLLPLPKKMKTDLAINVHFNTLSKVNLFQDCDKNLLSDLVLKLQPVLFLPGDYICRKGEVGLEMYIVVMGQVEVVGGPNNSLVFATLREGSVFGEISLLALAGGNRRTADVRSKGYSQLFLLSKADFDETMAEYPDVQKLLKKKAKRLLSKNQQQVEKATAVEEVIKSRRGTPKLLRTVIQVVDGESNIPDYLGYRRRSSYRSQGSSLPTNDMPTGGRDVESSLAMRIDDDVIDEILVITQTELPMDGTCSRSDLSERHQRLGGSSVSSAPVDLTQQNHALLVRRTRSEESLVSAVQSILEVPVTTDPPQNSTASVDASAQSDANATPHTSSISRQNMSLDSSYSYAQQLHGSNDHRASPVDESSKTTTLDETKTPRKRPLAKAATEHAFSRVTFRPPSPVIIYPFPHLNDDVSESMSESNC